MQTKKTLRFALIIGLITLALVLVAACSAPPLSGTTTATEAPPVAASIGTVVPPAAASIDTAVPAAANATACGSPT